MYSIFRQTSLRRNYHVLAAAAKQQYQYHQSYSSAFWKWGAVGAAFGIAGLTHSLKSDACGIIAFVGEDENDPALKYLLEGITILQNRGYDSAGVATIDKGGNIKTTKFASVGSTNDSIKLLKNKAPQVHTKETVGIAHTRWATHGGATDENAHPHSDMKDRIALVHNGTIENCAYLKEELLQKGITFKSQTDTEVIANLIGYYMDGGMSTLDAIQSTVSRLEGTWGLCILSKAEPDQIVIARHGSPLMVGIADGCTFVASEHTAFLRHTPTYIAIEDGEIAVIKANSVSLDLERTVEAHKEEILLSPEPYPHWTIKEIYEQPEAVARSLNFGARLDHNKMVKLGGLDTNKENLSKIDNLLIGACGTSYFAAQYGARLMRYLNSFDTVQTIDAAEINEDTFPLNPSKAGLLVISQSGETRDVFKVVAMAEDLGVTRFSVINAVGSLIARTTQCGVYVNAGREFAVASTKAFTTQVTCLALIAGWFSRQRNSGEIGEQRRNQILKALHRLPTYIGMTLKTTDQVSRIAEKLKDSSDIFVVGQGFGEPIAKEGALKIKEITYIHAEGIPAGSLKHGAYAVLEKGTPVIALVLEDKNLGNMLEMIADVKARGANVIVISDNPSCLPKDLIPEENVIEIPSNGPLTALLGVIPLQLLAYHLSIARKIDPDNPKNLAKVVTVD